jgi:diadenosine tetraphosphate (Ap4A) HIT family hydrolase
VFPSIGQLVEGYLLIAPVEHFATIGEMPSSMLAELADIYEDVKMTAFRIFGSCLSFEHGARDCRSGGCGIYHAHLHVVPFGDFRDPLPELRREFPCEPLQRLQDIQTAARGLSSYLFYEDMKSNPYLFAVENLPSQYMRRLLAEILGSTDWNWNFAEREVRLLNTVTQLSGQFAASATVARA